MADKGRLKIQCFNNDTYIPVEGTKILVTSAVGTPGKTTNIELTTNSMGETETIELDAPPFAYSQSPEEPV
ncbi:MAG: spore cortex-lytic protein, partial [Clostridium sp.]